MKNSSSSAVMKRDGLLVILFITACFIASQFLGGCVSTRPAPTTAVLETEHPSVALPVASSVGTDSVPGAKTTRQVVVPVSEKKPTLLQRIFSPKPAKTITVASGTSLGNCKKCIVNVVHGTQTNLTAGKKSQVANGSDAAVVNTGKKSGPAVIKSDSVAQNIAGANAQQTTTTGNNNQVDAKKQDTTVEPDTIGGAIAKAVFTPIGGVIGLGLVVLALYLVFKPKRTLV